ncbi:MAG: hypothetical protein ACYTG2_01875 [Planctomycetota bacterium]|jgi:hypothetical protein
MGATDQAPAAPAPTGPAPRRSLPRRVLVAVVAPLLPLLLLLVLGELVLALFGLGGPDTQLSLSRGFDARAAYLIPDPDHPGGYITQMSDGDWPETVIPPRDARRRVVLVGGSNTRSFPQDDLEEKLNARSPDPGYEVVNLGRPGYGSDRVRILVAQAEVLLPDVVLVYCGHNEFVEGGFAMELRERWRHPLLMSVGMQLSRLRLVNVLASALRGGAADASGAPRPEPRVQRDNAFRSLNYRHTRVFFDVYRENLRAICRSAEGYGARVLFSTVIGNMIDGPTVGTLDPELSGEARARLRSLSARAGELMPERLVRGIVQTGPDAAPLRLRPFDWGDNLLPAARQERAADSERRDAPSLRPLPPPLDTGPYWLDPVFWNDKVRTVVDTAAAFHARRLDDTERAAVQEARDLLEEALTLSADDPMTLHRLAWCVYLLREDDERAVQLFRESAAWDRAPTRGNDVTNGIVRDVAAEFPEVLLVDAEQLFRSYSPGGLISYELMMDNCHLHRAVRPRLMDEFVEPLLELAKR